jgi:Domain of unknown function (DUF4184)
MPCVVPSHQAPVLPLKLWRPHLFSGLGLCLGTIAPDLEFILRVESDWAISHTLAGQLYFTVPMVLILYFLLVRLALPFWLPRLPLGGPCHFDELLALQVPKDLGGWARVAVSGHIGGLTHIVLDGVTHGNHSGWLVPYLPFLRTPIGLHGGWPLHDVLQVVLSVWFAVSACGSWRLIARERLLWRWRGEAPRPVIPVDKAWSRSALGWIFACAALGFVAGPALRGGIGPWAAIDLAAFGAIAFAFYGFLALPAAEAFLRMAWRATVVRPA